MPRYIFTHTNKSEIPAEHMAKINESGRVLDRTLQSLLVETTSDQVARLAPALDGWTIEPEQKIPVPDSRKRIKQPA
jgi:hypothetical protein